MRYALKINEFGSLSLMISLYICPVLTQSAQNSHYSFLRTNITTEYMKTKTKLQAPCPSYRPAQALAASVYLLIAVLFASCTTEADKADRTSADEADNGNRREVLLSFKNKLTVKTTKAETKVATKADAPIATEAENEIATLDVYVFGAKAEGDAYTFRERFSYRQDGSALPAGAKELNLTPSTDNATTTALLELQKGLFVRLYCIANQMELINPVDGNPVADTYFTPLTYDVETGVLTDGIPAELQFRKFHTPLLTNVSPALGMPLPMAGAQTTPIDLTDFGSSARVQVGFKLTRTMARFDVSNIETESKFHLESISMGNGRRGATFFPIKVYGAATAADGELISYPVRAFEGEKANTGLQVSAFYSYPSPLEDKGYLILNGTYRVNETETKEVSYQIPFRQQTADGGSVELAINANHRYTIGITKADEHHLDFTLDVADWDDSGSIDDYNPEISGGDYSLTVTVVDALRDKIIYDDATRMVTMKTLKDGDSFIVEVNASREPELKKSYVGMQAVQQYDWLEVSAATPVTKSTASGYQYTVSLKPGYDKEKYPQAVLRFMDSASGTETALSVILPLGKPVLSSPEAVTLHAEADNDIPEIIIAGQCFGGSEISGPDWLTYETTGTDEETFSYKVRLIPSLTGFPESVPAEQTLTITNKRASSLKTTVKVSFTEAEPWMTDLTGYTDDSEHDPGKGYRVTPLGKTLTISYYSMFTEPKKLSSEINYDPNYCTDTNGGNNWLNVTYSKSIGENRCKYTYSIQIAPATGDDPEYQLHKATLHFKKQEGTEVQSYTLWRGASYVGYPMGSGSASPYYTAIKKGTYYWAPVNLGATRVAQAGDGKNMTVAGTGNIYQWGRYEATNHGGPTANGPISNTRPGNNSFYKAPYSPWNWLDSQNNSLWNGSSKGTNDPCPPGYRVPTFDELWSIGNATEWDGSGGLFIVDAESGYPRLVLPAAGGRVYSDGSSYYQGSDGYYWSSSVPSGSTYARYVHFFSATFRQDTYRRAYGYSVRCLQEKR